MSDSVMTKDADVTTLVAPEEETKPTNNEETTPTEKEEKKDEVATASPEEKKEETPSDDNSKEKKEETTSTTTEEKKDEVESTSEKKDETTKEEEKKPDSNPLVLKNLDLDLTYDVLSIPTASSHEYRMVTFIMLWARANKINYEFDTYGNIYLTKGELAEGEFYPCVTAHLDTVQHEAEAYAQCGAPLELKERVNTKGGHELYVQGMGIGADDKAGVLISLNLFEYFDKLKACFFLEEEIGCKGSKNLNKDWFKDVGYVIGWDSPDRDRAAFACSSELLMSKAFFENIKDVCKENGVTKFNSEPFTDVKEIRSQTQVMCMNFGNGGYLAHSATEYVVLEDIDGALGLGIALIKHLGLTKHRMESKSTWTNRTHDEDVAFFDKMDNRYGYNYYGGNYNNRNYYGGSSNTGTTHTTTTDNKKDKKEDTNVTTMIEYNVLEHAVERYEKHIDNIQTKVENREAAILKDIKALLETGEQVTYDDILNIFIDNPSSEPFSTAVEF